MSLTALLRTVPSATTDTSVLESRRTDRSGVLGAEPRAVVLAASVGEVQATAAWAHEHRVPLVARGAGTGLAGGAIAGGAIADGAVVIDLSGLNRILELDPVDELAVVEPGVITAHLDAAAREHGLFFAPDPASAAISTVGGNIATNAGGVRCVKYGVTRESVLGLDVVLADGRRISTGRRTAKGVAGYDLTSLFVGSEGTLGLIVGATVRLRPVPTTLTTLAAAFDSPRSAAEACTALAARRLQPSMLELLDEATLDVVDRAQGTALREHGDALVIAQFESENEHAAAREFLRPLGGDPDEWLAARRLALPSIEHFGSALIEDICVPRSKLGEAFARVREIRADTGADVYTFAHAGDGNLHPILGFQRPGPPPEAIEAADRIFALALELGGTVTGEHGVGALKRDWLLRELGEDTHAVHTDIKRALDPRGVLNPGRAI
ncbi:FAD-binding protein [Solirubrobacter taibaiensis]|nr:FAD-binding protein [Solirubrobacter taibaiensis]